MVPTGPSRNSYHSTGERLTLQRLLVFAICFCGCDLFFEDAGVKARRGGSPQRKKMQAMSDGEMALS